MNHFQVAKREKACQMNKNLRSTTIARQTGERL